MGQVQLLDGLRVDGEGNLCEVGMGASDLGLGDGLWYPLFWLGVFSAIYATFSMDLVFGMG